MPEADQTLTGDAEDVGSVRVVEIELPPKGKLGMQLTSPANGVIDHGLDIVGIDNPLLENKVMVGDVIVAIGGQNVDQMGYSDAIDLIRQLPRPLAITIEIREDRRQQALTEKMNEEDLDKLLTPYSVQFDDGPLGFSLEDGVRFGINGVVVSDINGQAKTSGMISVGDIVFKVEETEVLGMPYEEAINLLRNAATPKTLHFVPKNKLADVQRVCCAALEMGSLSALLIAAADGNDELVQELIERGADVDARGKDGEIALRMAVKSGREETVKLLLELGASVNAVTNTKRTALMMAAGEGFDTIAKLLIDHGAAVNAANDDKCTPLILAAQYGHEQVVRTLIDHGADINAEDDTQFTPLIWAAEYGHDKVVQILIDHGALIDAKTDANQTALMIAASEGHTETVKVLLAAGSSTEVRNNDDETALTLAIDNNHQVIVHELLNRDVEMSTAMEILKLGLQKRRNDAAEKAKAKEKAKAEVKIEDLVQLCSKMNETQAISERVYARLVDVEKELSTLSELIRQEATPRFKQHVEKTHDFMIKHADKRTVTRLVGNQVMIDTSRDLNRELDALLLQFDIPNSAGGVHDWKKQWDIDSAATKSFLKESLKNKDVLMDELQDPAAQTEALTLLMFECSNNASQYSDEEMALINELFQYVSSMSRLEIPAVPRWFVPPHEVQYNAKASFAGGSYGSVHYGTWNGTAVVVKSAFLEDDKSREMFLNETEIWSKLRHPHIVTLFRACHIGNPFFVCDLASNGTLSDYLYRDKNHLETWAKLHEAALGLQYLHTKQKVVHGDLKCNNILISADGKAKLTDFGLSFVLGDREAGANEVSLPHEVGAIRWKAPEVMNCSTRGTFASDVYSFGMCIVEAVTG